MPIGAIVSWSCGKDSAAALHRLQANPDYQVVGLLTTLTEGYGRVSMSGVRRELLHAQAAALGLPVHEVWIPAACVNPVYEARMAEAVARLKAAGVKVIAFGDLFLEDVRAYRERQMALTGIECVFPIWGEDTDALARRLIADGFRATLVCVDPRAVPAELAGRAYDESLLADLPEGADPCGERGEFHTFVWDAPNFKWPVPVRPGERVQREGFSFADVLPAQAPS